MTGAGGQFAERLLAWFHVHGRHDLPWQREPTPYHVWVSEVMLQQTRVSTVIPYYRRFVQRFPDVRDLARAHMDEVLALWSGLGYYSRARNLHAAAKKVVQDHGGELPMSLDELMALPGIGRSTAGAILALSAGQRHAILDGNCKRVLARYHGIEGWPGKTRVQRALWARAEAHLPERQFAEYTQAIMDLGATVCTRARPACHRCPLNGACVAFREGRAEAYPTPRPRRTLPVRSARLLIATRDDRVLLERRPPSGVWGGLWSLPELPEGNWKAWLRRLGLSLDGELELPPFTHTFTHYRLNAYPVVARVEAEDAGLIMDASDLRWVRRQNLSELGLPAPVRRLLEENTVIWHEPSSA